MRSYSLLSRLALGLFKLFFVLFCIFMSLLFIIKQALFCSLTKNILINTNQQTISILSKREQRKQKKKEREKDMNLLLFNWSTFSR